MSIRPPNSRRRGRRPFVAYGVMDGLIAGGREPSGMSRRATLVHLRSPWQVNGERGARMLVGADVDHAVVRGNDSFRDVEAQSETAGAVTGGISERASRSQALKRIEQARKIGSLDRSAAVAHRQHHLCCLAAGSHRYGIGG